MAGVSPALPTYFPIRCREKLLTPETSLSGLAGFAATDGKLDQLHPTRQDRPNDADSNGTKVTSSTNETQIPSEVPPPDLVFSSNPPPSPVPPSHRAMHAPRDSSSIYERDLSARMRALSDMVRAVSGTSRTSSYPESLMDDALSLLAGMTVARRANSPRTRLVESAKPRIGAQTPQFQRTRRQENTNSSSSKWTDMKFIWWMIEKAPSGTTPVVARPHQPVLLEHY
ncbi:hypothetical protein BDZ45DRAFT_742069 [Acephala macrosclerotiorum]|nr:hypothetical protein BDZ45DRAFT_742069 [Acephala macrosclerotiorum]